MYLTRHPEAPLFPNDRPNSFSLRGTSLFGRLAVGTASFFSAFLFLRYFLFRLIRVSRQKGKNRSGRRRRRRRKRRRRRRRCRRRRRGELPERYKSRHRLPIIISRLSTAGESFHRALSPTFCVCPCVAQYVRGGAHSPPFLSFHFIFGFLLGSFRRLFDLCAADELFPKENRRGKQKFPVEIAWRRRNEPPPPVISPQFVGRGPISYCSNGNPVKHKTKRNGGLFLRSSSSLNPPPFIFLAFRLDDTVCVNELQKHEYVERPPTVYYS